jgi:hypothetical protein
MPKTDGTLPDVDAETLNAMISDIARELGCPWWASPDLVEFGAIPMSAYGLNVGCKRTGLDAYREGQRWRRKAIGELKRRPEWCAAWLAAAELDRRIEALCERKGLRFELWECPAWLAPDELPERDPDRTALYAGSLPQAVRLRRQLIAEIEEQGWPPQRAD